MNNVKFKCWDVEKKIMYDIAWPTWNGMIEVWKDNIPQSEVVYLSVNGPEEQGILLQYTGSTDSNGGEIYEGYICKWKFNNLSAGKANYEISKIEFRKGSFLVTPKCKENSMHLGWIGYRHEGSENLNIEIIGNVFENPELLEA